jgi:hypothetical protein
VPAPAARNCGGKGAVLQWPGWAGNNFGFYPFPINADVFTGESATFV